MLQDTLYAAEGGPDQGEAATATAVIPTWYPSPIDERTPIDGPGQAADVLQPYVTGSDRERCVAAMLDTKNRLLGVSLVSIGSISLTFMAPGQLYRDALLANASSLVVAHNHPSGDPEPSPDDLTVTRRLVQAGDIIGITLLDSLVFGGHRWISLSRRGAI